MTRSQLMAAYKAAGKNLMTPRKLAKRVLVARRTIVELSQGEGFAHEPIYGVSVLQFTEDGERIFSDGDKDKSKLFRNYSEARRYYGEVKPELPTGKDGKP